jgi:hypothetical protein
MEQKPILESIDPEVAERLAARGEAIRQGEATSSAVAAGLAMASVPVALAALTRDAFAQAPANIIAVLNFALTLEHLEAEFYARGIAGAVAGALTAAELTAVKQIGRHEAEHVRFLQRTIQALGGTPVARPTFDFTAGNGSGTGPFAGVFTNRTTFLAVAQAFEDTGVRAYKGQAGNLMSNKTVLEAALQIHSVEARHAAQIRRLRGEKAFIQGRQNTLPPQAQAVYGGSTPEDNTIQKGINVANLPGNTGGVNAATRAYDEPLTREEVLAIVDPFIV